ncbi:MAG: hypothetical protein CVU43_15705 [Chloroflexi bacterium HGW-Chloroflexi-5]|nr:MAG: hypothetical protein CVU43_15705 [Chloroflexi bacterium HGW-Chloroflexi-5]
MATQPNKMARPTSIVAKIATGIKIIVIMSKTNTMGATTILNNPTPPVTKGSLLMVSAMRLICCGNSRPKITASAAIASACNEACSIRVRSDGLVAKGKSMPLGSLKLKSRNLGDCSVISPLMSARGDFLIVAPMRDMFPLIFAVSSMLTAPPIAIKSPLTVPLTVRVPPVRKTSPVMVEPSSKVAVPPMTARLPMSLSPDSSR